MKEVFADGGELGRLMTAMDWSATALGPVGQWPRALVTAVRIILTSRQRMSGYPRDAAFAGGTGGLDHPFLQKPIPPELLIQTVSDALAEVTSG